MRRVRRDHVVVTIRIDVGDGRIVLRTDDPALESAYADAPTRSPPTKDAERGAPGTKYAVANDPALPSRDLERDERRFFSHERARLSS